MTSLIYLYTLFARFNTLGADRDHKARVGGFEDKGASRLLFLALPGHGCGRGAVSHHLLCIWVSGCGMAEARRNSVAFLFVFPRLRP